MIEGLVSLYFGPHGQQNAVLDKEQFTFIVNRAGQLNINDYQYNIIFFDKVTKSLINV